MRIISLHQWSLSRFPSHTDGLQLFICWCVKICKLHGPMCSVRCTVILTTVFNLSATCHRQLRLSDSMNNSFDKQPLPPLFPSEMLFTNCRCSTVCLDLDFLGCYSLLLAQTWNLTINKQPNLNRPPHQYMQGTADWLLRSRPGCTSFR